MTGTLQWEYELDNDTTSSHNWEQGEQFLNSSEFE